MKSFAATICLALGLLMTHAQESVLITGSIANFGEQEIRVDFVEDFISKKSNIFTTRSDSKGVFELTIDIKRPQTAAIYFGKRRKGMVLLPGDTVTVQFDEENYKETVSYTGKAASGVRYFSRYYGKFRTRENQSAFFKSVQEMSPDAYQQEQLNSLKEKEAFLLAFHEKDPLADYFKTLQQNMYRYEFAQNNFLFANVYANRLDNDSTGTLLPLPATFYHFLSEVNIQNEEALANYSYMVFLQGYLRYKHQQLYQEIGKENSQNKMPGAEMPSFLRTANILFSGKIRDFMMAILMQEQLNNGEYRTIQKMYVEYMASNAQDTYKASLESVLEATAAYQAGQVAPSITLKTATGQAISLSDFKGKVIYIDFWASWCRPCLAEAPAAKELEAAFADNEDLVFFNISLDENRDAWKEAIEKYELHGIHVIADKEQSDVAADYGIKSIPRYYLINRDGTISNPDAPRPSSGEEIRQEIETALGLPYK